MPGSPPRYRVTVVCQGIAPEVGPLAADDIVREFSEHRPWQAKPRCVYAEGSLHLTAENDFDPCGNALLDEFLDDVVAYLGPHGPASVTRVEEVGPGS